MAVIGLVAGFAVGCASGTSTPAAEAADVPMHTPQSCLDALDEADSMMELFYEFTIVYSDSADVAARSVEAAANWDSTELNNLRIEVQGNTERIDEIALAVDRNNYAALADQCRSES